MTPPPLAFGADTAISDLTYYAEKGCVADVLAALTVPHLKTLGARMLADYAKMPHRRVAVASNATILEFVQNTALEVGNAIQPQCISTKARKPPQHPSFAIDRDVPTWRASGSHTKPDDTVARYDDHDAPHVLPHVLSWPPHVVAVAAHALMVVAGAGGRRCRASEKPKSTT